MIYKMLAKVAPDDLQVYARVDDDGIYRVTCDAENLEFQAWIAQGNTPLPPDPVE